ncbi:MAG TPA: PIN domain-containing protein [Terriglobales bacterium]|nr:PIN domain-containing protein [Terriglobales bacterium]
MKAAVDTNLLVYAEGLNSDDRRREARALLQRLNGRAVLPAQVVFELFNVLMRKGQRSPVEARWAALQWCEQFPLLEVADGSTWVALELVEECRLSVWDAIVLATAELGQCQVLLSEDLQHGFCWRGVTVVNPFAAPQHPLLEALLAGD